MKKKTRGIRAESVIYRGVSSFVRPAQLSKSSIDELYAFFAPSRDMRGEEEQRDSHLEFRAAHAVYIITI